MPIVVTKTAETNAVSTYYVSALAGPKVAGRRVAKGDALSLSEHQARGELATGALVTDESRVDDPFNEKALAEARAKAEEEARAAAAKAAADAKAVADKAAAEAKAAAEKGAPKSKPADATTPPAAG